MYNSSRIADRIKATAKLRNISIKSLLENVGLGFNTMSNMKTSMPKADNLAKIADYLDCSVDYLLGRSNQENTSCDSYTLSQDEKTLINIFRTLPPESQQNILGFLDYTASVIINDQNTAKRAARSIKDKSAQTTSHQFNSADLDSIDDDNSNL